MPIERGFGPSGRVFDEVTSSAFAGGGAEAVVARSPFSEGGTAVTEREKQRAVIGTITGGASPLVIRGTRSVIGTPAVLGGRRGGADDIGGTPSPSPVGTPSPATVTPSPAGLSPSPAAFTPAPSPSPAPGSPSPTAEVSPADVSPTGSPTENASPQVGGSQTGPSPATGSPSPTPETGSPTPQAQA